MANIDAAFGLRPSKQSTGEGTKQNEYSIADGYSTAIYIGDPVGLSSGNVVIGTDAGTAHIGVFAGCEYVNGVGDFIRSKAWPADTAATKIKCLVLDDPDTVFTIQASTFATANIGVAYDLDVTAGTAAIGLSKTFLNVAGTTGAAYKVLRKVDREDNETGAYAEVEVIAVKHALASS